jgi:hypothetical protein
VGIPVVQDSLLVDFGFWSACEPVEVPEAMRNAVASFSHRLCQNDIAAKEILDKLMLIWQRIVDNPDEDLAMGYPILGVRGYVELDDGSSAYLILMR